MFSKNNPACILSQKSPDNKIKQSPLLRGLFAALLLLGITPVSSLAVVAKSIDVPDTVLAASIGIDIIEYAGAVWVITGGGVNFTFDNGDTWLLYNRDNGLSSDNLSAIFAQNNRLWLGANHEELIDNQPYTLSDGLFYTDDSGDNWVQYDFNSLPLDKIYGFQRYVYDIDGHYDPGQNENWLFFGSFAAGLVASRDGGMSWRRLYPTSADSTSFTDDPLPSLRMLYFSCATDTSRGDTLTLWGGTAAGIFEYLFVHPREKLFTKTVNQIALCEDCSDPEGSYVFLAGNTGFSRVTKTGKPFVSRFQTEGLPGDYITAVTDFGGRVFVGTAGAGGTSSTGLAYSDDRGDSFTPDITFNSTYATGPNTNRIYDFATIGDRLYVAAESAGLFVTDDTGQTWARILVDSSDITSANRRNAVFSIEGIGDTLNAGTDSGLVRLFLDPAGLIDSSRFFVFGEDTINAARIVQIRTQTFYDSTGMNIDSAALWTVNRQITSSGTPMVGRSNDGGVNFDRLQIGQGVNDLIRDVNFLADTVILVGANVYRELFSYVPGVNPFTLTISDSTGTDNLNNNILTGIEIDGDTIIIGTDNGIAMSNSRGSEYRIHRVNTDSLKADVILLSNKENSSPLFNGITGNFIQAIEVQYVDGGAAIVWASNSPVGSGELEGIAVGAVIRLIDTTATPDDTIYTRQWLSQYPQFAWNYAFDSMTVYAATDSGLVYTSDSGFTWDTVQFVDDGGFTLYDANRPIYGVAVVDSFLWAGGEDRILRVNLNSGFSSGYLSIDSASSAEEVYAYPVPYSNVLDDGTDITFRFVLQQDASVTIEVYDFAMNLVRRVIDNQFFSAGFYPTVTTAATWDALNGKGDQLAVGMYYFKIEYSTGETRWGKLAIIP